MIQSRGSSCLSPKALERLRVSGYIFREKLESDKATEFDVFGLVDDSHTAAAQLLDDAVMRDGLADHVDAMLGALQVGSQRDACSGTGSRAQPRKGPVFAPTTLHNAVRSRKNHL